MENKIGLELSELEQIFAKIKNGADQLDSKIYSAYLPLKDSYAKKFHIKDDPMQDIYDDVFSYVYNNVLNGVLKPGEFGKYFEMILVKQCTKYSQDKVNFKSEMLSRSYTNSVAQEATEVKHSSETDFATVSLMYIYQVLTELQKNPEMAAEHGLNEQKIEILKDYLGFNKEHKRFNATEIAEKHQISETRARAVLATGLKTLRDMKEFKAIKTQLHRS